MNEFHYITSGCAYLKFGFSETYKDFELLDWIRNALRIMSSGSFRYGVLYNAYAEQAMGEKIWEFLNECVCDIHSDSGGLQAMRFGTNMDDSLRDSIYNHQRRFSTIAMSFDDIPVYGYPNRWYDRSKNVECATNSGRYLARQLEMFAEMGSNAKPLLIVQGNCYDSFMEWTSVLLDQIPPELKTGIHGVALAASAHGSGMLEDIQKAFYFTQLPIDFRCDQIHILGVGSKKRAVPVYTFMRSGAYKDAIVSFDSTTHSSALVKGSVMVDGKMMALPRHYDKQFYAKLFNELVPYNTGVEDEYHLWGYLNLFNGQRAVKEHGKSYSTFVKVQISCFILGVTEFKKHYEYWMMDSNPCLSLPPALRRPMMALAEVNNMQDFIAWERDFARHMPSTKIPNLQRITLDNYF